jgi:APA family basic amino acid/polyamine antiporter
MAEAPAPDPTPAGGSADGAPKLHRALSRWDGIAVAVGSVIGVGIFRTTGEVFRGAGGATGAIAIWVGMGLMALVGSLVYADLATRVPEAGGPYAYVREGFGRFAASLDGWLTVVAGNPALQAAGVAQIAELVGNLIGRQAPRAIGVAVVLALAGMNWIGVRAGARSQRAFTLFKLVALTGLVVLALLPARHAVAPEPAQAPIGLVAALSAAWYTYIGWVDGSLLAEDLREPRRDLPWVLIGSVAIVMTVYVTVNVAIIYAARGTDLASRSMPALALAERVLGPTTQKLMGAFILVSMIGGTAEGFMVHPRLGFALARDRLAPRTLVRVNRGGTPSAALGFHSIVILALVLTGRFKDFISLLVFAQALQTVLEAAAYFPVRRRVAGLQRTPLHPVLPALFVAANAALAVSVAWDDPMSILKGLGAAGAAAVAYGIYRLLQ